VLEGELVVPGGDAGLEAVCLKCLAREPARRYESASALAAELRRWLDGEPLSVRPPGAASRLLRWVRRNVRAALLVGLAGVAGSVVASLWLLSVFCGGFLRDAALAYDDMPATEPPALLAWLRLLAFQASLWWPLKLAGEVTMRFAFGTVGLAAVLAAAAERRPRRGAGTRRGHGRRTGGLRPGDRAVRLIRRQRLRPGRRGRLPGDRDARAGLGLRRA
jgi:hypothetical protein